MTVEHQPMLETKINAAQFEFKFFKAPGSEKLLTSSNIPNKLNKASALRKIMLALIWKLLPLRKMFEYGIK